MVKFIRQTTIAILAIVFLWGAQARAQEYPWRFSLHIDPGFNWFYVDNPRYANSGADFGFCAGTEAEWALVERVSLLFGLSYDLRFADVKYKENGFVLKMKYEEEPIPVPAGVIVETQAQYLKLPVGIKMRAVQIGYFTITAATGISGQFLLTQRAAAPSIKVEKAKTTGMFNWAFLGYFIRAGVEYSLGGRSAVEAGLGYYGTFTSVYEPGVGGLGYHNIAFRIGFVF